MNSWRVKGDSLSMGVGQARWCPCLLRGREKRTVFRNIITRGSHIRDSVPCFHQSCTSTLRDLDKAILAPQGQEGKMGLWADFCRQVSDKWQVRCRRSKGDRERADSF